MECSIITSKMDILLIYHQTKLELNEVIYFPFIQANYLLVMMHPLVCPC